MDINEELKKLNDIQKKEFEEWIVDQIYKFDKVNKNEKLNYVPYLKRKQVIWVDFGVNPGKELNYPHPAVVIYSNDKAGTVLVAPLTSKKNDSKVTIKLGIIEELEKISYCKIDQIQSVSKLRIKTKKHNGKYYNSYNISTGKYSNPKVTSEQMDLIDKAIEKLRYLSK